MELLYGTTNPAKLQHMRYMLEGLNIEIIGLNELEMQFDGIDENGNDPLENAKIKALAYYRSTRIPVFSADSGLYIEGLDKERQPGVHVRRVNGKVLNDEEMIAYYSNLALELGGQVKAKYKNAICLVLDENNIFEYDGDDISSIPFIITSKPHLKRINGFPLDSVSMNIADGTYYLDTKPTRSSEDDSLTKGFRNFFIRVLNESSIKV